MPTRELLSAYLRANYFVEQLRLRVRERNPLALKGAGLGWELWALQWRTLTLAAQHKRLVTAWKSLRSKGGVSPAGPGQSLKITQGARLTLRKPL